MNIDTLKNCLKPWIQVSTWHTGHPNDQERFNKALKSAYQALGYRIHSSDFEDAITDLVNEYAPDLAESAKEERVREFVIQSEYITNYLLDTDTR